MNKRPAEEQLRVVYDHIARNVGFRGFRPGPIALVGVASAALGLLWGLVAVPGDLLQAAVSWIAAALVVVTSVFLFLVLPDLLRRAEPARSAAVGVVNQFLPALLFGAVVSVVLVVNHRGTLPYLPSAWFVLYALALLSLGPAVPIPVLPIVALYTAAACASYAIAPALPSVFSLVAGTGFGVGHLVTAWMLSRAARDDL